MGPAEIARKLPALPKLRMRAGRGRWVFLTLLGLFITGVYFFAHGRQPAPIEQVSNLLFDEYQKAKPREYDPETPVRVVDIDQTSLEKIGQWPWPRTTLALMNDRLAEAGAIVIAYDVVFSEPDRTSPENIARVLDANPGASGAAFDLSALTPHDEIFAQSFAQSYVVGGYFLNAAEGEGRPVTTPTMNWSGTEARSAILNFSSATTSRAVLQSQMLGEGFITIAPDSDFIVRKPTMLYRIGETILPSLSLEALRVAQDAKYYIITSSGSSFEDGMANNSEFVDIAKVRVGEFELDLTQDGAFNVYYTSSPEPRRFIPAWKILSDAAEDQDWREQAAGRLIFVGTSAEGLKDIRATPVNAAEAGVVVHAQVAEQAIAGVFLRRPYTVIITESLAILGFGLLLSFILPHLGAAKGAFLTLGLGAGAAFTSWFAFSQNLYLLSPVYPMMTLLTAYILMTLASLYMTETERSRIRGAFSMYLSPAMVKRVSEEPELLKLGGEDRRITILFLDVRSFSKISEMLEPSEITTFLNLFLTPMTEILQKNHATIDKYIGDAIVAFWNAPLDDPQHEMNAARAVLDMHAALITLNDKYRESEDIKWPDNVAMGIGLNTGTCTVGNLGSAQRFNYSMIGDAANLSSRIEGLTKQYGLEILLGYETAKALPDLAILEMDKIKVVGRSAPERIFTLAGLSDTAQDEAFIRLKDSHDAFLAAYRAQSWDEATGLALSLEQSASAFGLSKYYAIMAGRAAHYKVSPPPNDWDGVHIATQK
ncbi:CHASE2 domain-containing protein [Robiginitomaculum antarcticum]|uniref:CHASE2 domain-containing protein n=1 Tax=Robiginitomaculum antarcticum TaxID=437507 RepID=UPI0009FDC430|nr:adenylate/guanylate cyclase domain-containing protein [Robiginitomaculum antarcticum]